MPLNPAKVGLAVQNGLSTVCATCTRYWEGRDRGLPEPQCTASDGCGSPLRGDDFHEYVGPLSNFEHWCFVCGSASRFGVRVQGRSRMLGVCQTHVVWLGVLHPEGTTVAPSVELHGPSLIKAPQRRTVAQAILEVEEFYAKKAGEEFGGR